MCGKIKLVIRKNIEWATLWNIYQDHSMNEYEDKGGKRRKIFKKWRSGVNLFASALKSVSKIQLFNAQVRLNYYFLMSCNE